jgi:hypothetical protein
MRILYLHGFASLPDGPKARQLRALLEARGSTIVAPDLNVPSFGELDFEAMVRRAIEAVGSEAPERIIGSSLGSLVALRIARDVFEVPLVLIAPPLGCESIFVERIPATGEIKVPHLLRNDEPLAIHRAFFHQMAACDASSEPPRSQVHAFIGTADETVPSDRVRRRWSEWKASGRLAPGSQLEVIEGGDHALLAYLERIADAAARR